MSGSRSGAEPPAAAPLVQPLPALLAVGHAGFIWWLSSRRIEGGSGRLWSFLSNSFHFTLFAVLALLLAEALRQRGSLALRRLLLTLGLALFWGVVDEWHQSRTPGRFPDAMDVCVDLLGAIGALCLWWGVRGAGRPWTGLRRATLIGVAATALNAWRAWGRG